MAITMIQWQWKCYVYLRHRNNNANSQWRENQCGNKCRWMPNRCDDLTRTKMIGECNWTKQIQFLYDFTIRCNVPTVERMCLFLLAMNTATVCESQLLFFALEFWLLETLWCYAIRLFSALECKSNWERDRKREKWMNRWMRNKFTDLLENFNKINILIDVSNGKNTVASS